MTFAGKLLTCCVAGAMLVACGGGDDKKGPAGRNISYTGSTAAVVLSQGNVTTMAALATENVSGSVGSASGGLGYVGAVSVGGRGGYETALATVRAARRDFAVALAGAYGSITQPCAGGGSITMVASSASDTVATAGDYFEVSFAACNDGYGTIASGSMRVDITATDGGDPTVGTMGMTSGYPYGMRLVVTDFSIDSAGGWIGMEGNMDFTQTWNSTTFRLESSIEGASFVAAAGVGSTVTESSLIAPLVDGGRFSMTAVEEYADAFATTLVAEEAGVNAKVCSLAIGGCIRIETTQPFRQLVSQLYPASGSIRVSDELGHYIEIVPTDGSTGAVTVSWDVTDGVPPPDGTCVTTWATMSTACVP